MRRRPWANAEVRYQIEIPASEGSLDETEIDHWRSSLDGTTATEILHWAIDRWPQRVALCTAFQAEGSVLLDMAWRIDPGLRVITLDTGRLPQCDSPRLYRKGF